MKLMEYISQRLQEKSTWAGLGTILALVGMELHPDVLAALSAVIIAILALWEVLRREGR